MGHVLSGATSLLAGISFLILLNRDHWDRAAAARARTSQKRIVSPPKMISPDASGIYLDQSDLEQNPRSHPSVGHESRRLVLELEMLLDP